MKISYTFFKSKSRNACVQSKDTLDKILPPQSQYSDFSLLKAGMCLFKVLHTAPRMLTWHQSL